MTNSSARTSGVAGAAPTHTCPKDLSQFQAAWRLGRADGRLVYRLREVAAEREESTPGGVVGQANKR